MSLIHRMISVVLLAGAVAAGAASGAPADDPGPLGAEQTRELLGCGVTLAAARDNLTARGYVVDAAAATTFSTRYKMSERDSTRRLLGTLAVERARGYEVTAAANDTIRFVPRYRETEFAAGVLGKRNDTVKQYDVPLTTAMLETLKDMRREVCDPLGRPSAAAGAAPVNLDLQQYLQERCQAADDRACRLLQAR